MFSFFDYNYNSITQLIPYNDDEDYFFDNYPTAEYDIRSYNNQLLSSSFSSMSSSTTSNIPATSKLGNRLLSKARGSRRRRQLNNNDDDFDYSWVQGYSLKFESCHTISEFRADGGGGGSNDEDDASPVELKRLVTFKLCPTVEQEDDGYDKYNQYEYTSSC